MELIIDDFNVIRPKYYSSRSSHAQQKARASHKTIDKPSHHVEIDYASHRSQPQQDPGASHKAIGKGQPTYNRQTQPPGARKYLKPPDRKGAGLTGPQEQNETRPLAKIGSLQTRPTYVERA